MLCTIKEGGSFPENKLGKDTRFEGAFRDATIGWMYISLESVACLLRFAGIANPSLFVIRHAFQNMSNSSKTCRIAVSIVGKGRVRGG